MQMLNPDHFVTEKGRQSDPNAAKIAINEARDWRAFANHQQFKEETKIDGKTYPTVSVESWHDGIHVLLGGGQDVAGHLGDPRVAAVSPRPHDWDHSLIIA